MSLKRAYFNSYAVSAGVLMLLIFCSGSSGARADLNLIWSDEFNGASRSLDTNFWSFDIGNCLGNGELQYYTSSADNAYITNGVLHIAALKQPTNGFLYTSAQITTSGFNFCTRLDTGNGSYPKQYGRFEFRAKLPAGVGFWPAIWLLPKNNRNSPYGVWPAYGEIDVIENNGLNTNYVKGALHYNGGSVDAWSYVADVTQWHVYALDWSTNKFEWLVDGVTNHTATHWNAPSGYSFPAPFDTPFYIIINLAVGGSYAGNPTTNQINASLPGEMQVDYVRVYDQADPLAISVEQTNHNLVLMWPTNIVCRLQSQTHLDGVGNWSDIPGAKSPFLVSPVNDSAFFRLVSP